MDRARVLDAVQTRLAAHDGVVAQLAAELVARCRELTVRINQLQRQLEQLVAPLAPSLLGLAGCGG